jgi:hypothetical protein
MLRSGGLYSLCVSYKLVKVFNSQQTKGKLDNVVDAAEGGVVDPNSIASILEQLAVAVRDSISTRSSYSNARTSKGST